MGAFDWLGGGVITLRTALSPEQVVAQLEVATRRPQTFRLGRSAEVVGTFQGAKFRLESFAGRGTAYRRKFNGQVTSAGDGAVVSGVFRLNPVVRGLLLTIVAIVWLAALATAVQQGSAQPLAVALLAMLVGWGAVYFQLRRSADGEQAIRMFLQRTLQPIEPAAGLPATSS